MTFFYNLIFPEIQKFEILKKKKFISIIKKRPKFYLSTNKQNQNNRTCGIVAFFLPFCSFFVILKIIFSKQFIF